MNPDTNRFEPLKEQQGEHNKTQEEQRRLQRMELAQIKRLFATQPPMSLLRPDDSPVPQNWSVFTVGERVVLKDYTFRVAYIDGVSITLEPIGPCQNGS